MISFKEDFNFGMYSGICRQISFNLSAMMETTRPSIHFDVILDDFDIHSRSQLYEKSRTSVSIFFLRNFEVGLDEIQSVATCWFA